MEPSTIESLKKRFQASEPICSTIVGIMGLLSTKIRFRIVCALSKADLNVSDLLDIIGTCKQSNMSLQLKELTTAGIIQSHRKGNARIYSLADQRLAFLIEFFEKHFDPSKDRA